jgi:hypothetical protein
MPISRGTRVFSYISNRFVTITNRFETTSISFGKESNRFVTITNRFETTSNNLGKREELTLSFYSMFKKCVKLIHYI